MIKEILKNKNMIQKINKGFGKIEITFVKNVCVDVCLKEVHNKVNIDFNENKI